MYLPIRHECGARAYLVGKKLQLGWNRYLCSRCGEFVYRWVTEEMFKRESNLVISDKTKY